MANNKIDRINKEIAKTREKITEYPSFLCPLQSYLERGARTDPDLKNAC